MRELLSVLCCHTFHPELEAAARAEGWDDVRVIPYPVRCGCPAVRWEELLPLLPAGTTGVAVMGRACLNGLEPLEGSDLVTLIEPQQECFHLVAAPTLVNEAITRGSYLMTASWLAEWPAHLAKLGFAPDQAGEFFRDFACELLLLDSGQLSDAGERLQSMSQAVGLPARRERVGLDITRLLLRLTVNRLRWELERRRVQSRERRRAREVADLTTAMDLLGQLAMLQDEPEAVAAIEEMFRMLFAPSELFFVGWAEGVWQGLEALSPSLSAQVRGLREEWAWTASDTGFLLRLERSGHLQGVIVVEGLSFPAYREGYLETARSLAGICTLVIENARALRRIKKAEAALRRATTERLRESEIRFEATFEQAAVGIAVVSPEGRWLRVNRKLCQIVGYALEELMHLTFQEITHPDDLDKDLENVRRMLAGEIANYSMEKRYFHKNGDLVWINLTVSLVWRASGEPDYFIAVIEEIQARKEAESALRESEAHLREARRLAGLGDWKWDVRTGTHAWSEEVFRLLGCDPSGSPVGYPEVSAFFTRESWGPLADAVERSLVQGTPFGLDVEVAPENGGGTRWVTARGEALRDDDGAVRILRGTLQDITERKQAEEEIRTLNVELEARVMQRTAELEALNQELKEFAYVASHDLQEPLRTMNSYAEFLREDLGEALIQGAVEEDLRFISDAARRMQTLVQDLLAYSRSGRLEVKDHPVALGTCLTMVRENLQTSLEECAGTLTWGELPTVRGERSALISVFQNLLGNGLKFRRSGVSPVLRVEAEADGEAWRIRVSDNGIGIEERYLERIFLPFKRLHGRQAYPGSGLGLAIVKKIVERHGGGIRVESEPDRGSVFTVTLPCWHDDGSAS